ncbi:MAG: energy-coupled thiamine transporter ThiT [Lachnospiraceae bacterium]|nr:energy-coupled thiamine transporter ThiT [Lachnospiraceae bacterium]
MGNFITNEDGYYSLTQTGSVVMLIMVAALVVLTAFLASRAMAVESDKEKTDTAGSAATTKKVFSTKQLVVSALGIALAFALSYVRLIPMPWGGSVTLCSMLFVTIIGFWYGPVIGLTTALAYGLLEFVQDGASYMLNPMQVFLDYIFAFTALGISGFFNRFRNGLTIGYIAAVLARGVFHTIGGYLYWMDYMPENFPANLAAIYPICYNYSYLLLEAVITIFILSLPPVKKALLRIGRMVQE